MSAAIVPYRRGKLRRGAKSVAEFVSGGVAADVRVERIDKRNRTVWYSLKLASRECEVIGRLVGERRGSEVDELGSIAVAAGSLSSARFAVTTPRTGPYRTMYLEIRSEEMMLRVEAPRPPAGGPSLLKAGAWLLALGLAVMCAGAIPFAASRDMSLAVPAHAVAGSPVRLAYASAGFGAVSYVAKANDGTVVATEQLPARTGEIVFTPPARLASHRLSVTLSAQAPWGSASRTASFAVTRPDAPSAPQQVARVLSFAAHREAVADRESVLASYLAVADRGTLELLDPAGKIVRSVPFGRVGTTRIAVPAAYRDVPLTAQLTVHRKGTRAVSSIDVAPALRPMQFADPNADPLAAAVPDTVPGEAATPIDSSASSSSGGIVTVDGHAIAGRPLKLRIAPQESDIRLELEDQSGTPLAETRVASGVTRAVLPLPPATVPTTYLLALHYTHNGGEETVIRTVIAAPPPRVARANPF
jgi:hypothetical protein